MATKNNVAKNTVFLYLRMIVTIIIGLVTSRLVLKFLGETDYGVYNVVAGIVVLFSFLNNALTAGVQRFLNYYLGRNDKEKLKVIFAQSALAFLLLGLVIVVVAETLGLLLLEQYMNIPPERMNAARMIYQLSIALTFVNVLRIPFYAVIISYERMNFYAFMSILESVLKLAVCLLLIKSPIDNLLMYGLGLLGSTIIVSTIYIVYVKIKFDIVNFKRYKDKSFLKQIFTFSGWNILGTAGSIASNQGNNLLINRYFDVTVNAAFGVANNANNIIYTFLSGFQTAFNPHIVKLYSQGRKEEVNEFASKMSKLSFLLMFFIILPFIINIDFVLKLWLGSAPNYSNIFIIILCLLTLVDALGGPLWMLNEAEGNIKTYQIVSFLSCIPTIGFTILAFSLGGASYWGFLIHLAVSLAFSLWRILYLYKKMNFPWKKYMIEVVFPIILIALIATPIVYLVKHMISNQIISFFASCVASVLILLVLYALFGFTREEKFDVESFALTFIYKHEKLLNLYLRHENKKINKMNKIKSKLLKEASNEKESNVLILVSSSSSPASLKKIKEELLTNNTKYKVAPLPFAYSFRRSIRTVETWRYDELYEALKEVFNEEEIIKRSDLKSINFKEYTNIIIDCFSDVITNKKFDTKRMSKHSLLTFVEGKDNYPNDYIYNYHRYERDLKYVFQYIARNDYSKKKLDALFKEKNIDIKLSLYNNIWLRNGESDLEQDIYIYSSSNPFEEDNFLYKNKEVLAELSSKKRIIIKFEVYTDRLRYDHNEQCYYERIPEYLHELVRNGNVVIDVSKPYSIIPEAKVIITDDPCCYNDYKDKAKETIMYDESGHDRLLQLVNN